MFHLNEDVIVPVYEIESQKQEKALQIIRKLTGKNVIPQPVENLARRGGSVHCVTKEISHGLLYDHKKSFFKNFNSTSPLSVLGMALAQEK
jgi:hypothetical protein